jgi:hypothetical protein
VVWIDGAAADADTDPDRVVASVEVNVRNTGDRVGDEVVLLYVVPPPSAVAVGAPQQQLAAFARLSMHPGRTATTTLAITQRHLSLLGLRESTSKGGLDGWRVRVNEDEGTALEFRVRAQVPGGPKPPR